MLRRDTRTALIYSSLFLMSIFALLPLRASAQPGSGRGLSMALPNAGILQQEVSITTGNADQLQQIAVLEGHTDAVNEAVFSPDGTLIASGSSDQTVRLWDVNDLSEVAVLEGHTDWVNDVDFSPEGDLLASGSSDGTVRLWDVSDGSEVIVIEGISNGVNGVSFGPEGELLATAGADGVVRVFSMPSGEEFIAMSGHSGPVLSVDFDRGGLVVVSSGDDGSVRLWDISTGRELNALEGHTGFVNAVTYDPSNQLLATGGGRDDTVIVWDARRGRELAALEGHEESVNALAFNEDSTLLASGSADQSIIIWDLEETGEPLITLTEHTGWVNGVNFSPENTLLVSAGGVTGGEDATVRLWGLPEDVGTGDGKEEDSDGGDLGDLGTVLGGGGNGETGENGGEEIAEAEALDLDRSFVSDDDLMAFDYPDGWEVLYSGPEEPAVLISGVASLERFNDGDDLESEDVIALVFILEFDVDDPVTVVDALVEQVFGDADVSRVRSAEAGDFDAAYADVDMSGDPNDLRFYGVDLPRSFFGIMFVYTAEGNINAYHQTMLAIGGTLDPTP